MRTIYFTSESERRAVLPDATEDEAWRERTRLEMPDDNPGNFAPVCDRIHLKASQESKVPGPKADFVLPRLSLALRRHPPCVSASPSSPPLSPRSKPAARNWGGRSVSSSPSLNAAMLLYAMRMVVRWSNSTTLNSAQTLYAPFWRGSTRFCREASERGGHGCYPNLKSE